ncbi:hypothetical protein HDV57DRAFT_279379 [Trichoderma longibrachiatum]
MSGVRGSGFSACSGRSVNPSLSALALLSPVRPSPLVLSDDYLIQGERGGDPIPDSLLLLFSLNILLSTFPLGTRPMRHPCPAPCLVPYDVRPGIEQGMCRLADSVPILAVHVLDGVEGQPVHAPKGETNPGSE